MKSSLIESCIALVSTALVSTMIVASVAGAHDDQSPSSDGNAHLGWGFQYGDRVSLGNGVLKAFQLTAFNGRPIALGVEFHRAVLENLPEDANDGLNCWDLNEDGAVDLHDECSGGHNRILFFKPNLTPFKWMSIDWEPHGHVPEDVYGAQHFDFHFYIQDFVERNKIAVGPCMPGTIDCTQYDIAVKPVAPQYIHADFFNTNLAFSRMGNHWADRTSPEFNGEVFSNTFILGSYDAQITFYEPMVSLDYLLSKPNDCKPVKQAQQVQVSGFYPTSYCIRYFDYARTYRVSLERFIYRSTY